MKRNLTQTQKQIRIAKACKHPFKRTNVCRVCKGNTPHQAGDDYGIQLWAECPYCKNTGKVKFYYIGLRNYFGDLNVMNEAEKVLIQIGKKVEYIKALRETTYKKWPNHNEVEFASAEERAEAFGETLNLW